MIGSKARFSGVQRDEFESSMHFIGRGNLKGGAVEAVSERLHTSPSKTREYFLETRAGYTTERSVVARACWGSLQGNPTMTEEAQNKTRRRTGRPSVEATYNIPVVVR